MQQPDYLTLTLEASEEDLWALSQFIKRVGWQEFRSNAVDDAEAYQIRAGVDALQRALARAGYAPR
jgi:hypothetical protein